jgi:flagellar motor switch protein FliM
VHFASVNSPYLHRRDATSETPPRRASPRLSQARLPAILGVFKAEEWENFGLLTINSSLIYSIIDVLLGGRRGQTAVRIEGRPYTTIETNLVKRMIEVVLADAELAFKPLLPVKFNIDRLETNPRFAAISRSANAAILVRLRIDMEDRGGTIELLLPYATIEPIREVLLQMFMGEKFGRDPTWEGHPRHRDRAGRDSGQRRAL